VVCGARVQACRWLTLVTVVSTYCNLTTLYRDRRER
jgi:hypothetical protein